MAKQTLNANQRAAIAAILSQMKPGENWNAAHSIAAIGRLAVDHGLPEEAKKEFRADIGLLVNPSQTAQFLHGLPDSDACYRARIGSLASKLDSLD
jgi:hypothetical protein